MSSKSSGESVAPAAGNRLSVKTSGVLRRKFVAGIAVAGALLTLGGWVPIGAAVADADAGGRTPQGLGSVTGAPDLPPGFEKEFTSRFVDVGGERLHVVTGGDGPPLLLVHGWPQTWYAWRLVMPALARHFSVVAVDQRGVGLSDKPNDGYDSATLASDLVGVMQALGHEHFSIYGTDVGMPIAYAVAADHRDRVDRLAVSEGFLPGVTGGVTLLPLLQRSTDLNARLWHLAFNQLPPEVNEALVKGREADFFGAEFDASAGTGKLPADAVRYYVRMLGSDPGALHGSFGFYPALWTTADQDVQRSAQKLTLPVLAMGGEESARDTVGGIMKSVATDVQTLTIPGAAHWVAEQAPDEVIAALTNFLTS